MKAHRKIIVYIAASADGYIARPNGDVEWLNRRPHKFDYGMTAFYRTIDTILWGRKNLRLGSVLLQEERPERGDVRQKGHQLRVLKVAAETGSTRGQDHSGAGEIIRPASSSDAGKAHLDDGRG